MIADQTSKAQKWRERERERVEVWPDYDRLGRQGYEWWREAMDRPKRHNQCCDEPSKNLNTDRAEEPSNGGGKRSGYN